jgi:hypothetical protein
MGGLVKAANRGLVTHLGPATRKRIAGVMGGRALAWYRRQRADVALVSFPACGRTWLRVMVGKAFQAQYGLPDDADVIELHHLAEADRRVPDVLVTHDDDAQWKRPEDVDRDKSAYRRQRVVLLVRDPRDAIVSLYHHKVGRRAAYGGTLAEFLDEPVGGFASLLAFYDAWADSLDVPEASLVVRYEDLHARPHDELRRVLAFAGVDGVDDAAVGAAVEYGSFANMRRLEEAGTMASEKLRPVRVGDPGSYKTRRGTVGGHRDELTPAQIARLDALVAASHAGRFGYGAGAP